MRRLKTFMAAGIVGGMALAAPTMADAATLSPSLNLAGAATIVPVEMWYNSITPFGPSYRSPRSYRGFHRLRRRHGWRGRRAHRRHRAHRRRGHRRRGRGRRRSRR